MRLEMSRWPRRIVLFLAFALFVGLGCSTVYRANYSSVHRTDFTVYTAAGKAVLDGTNIYEARNIRGWYYMYLPIFAIAMVPFAVMNTFSAILLWYLLSAAMFAHGIELSARLARRAFPGMCIDDFWLRVLTALAVLPPALSGIARGQASVLIMYLVTLGVWFYFEKRPWAASLALAGGIVLKVFPALLALYFLVCRQFKYAAATVVWLILLLLVIPSAVFGPAANLALLRQWTTTIALPANRGIETAGSRARFEQMIDPRNNRNQSVQAVAIRTESGRIIEAHDKSNDIARPLSAVINLLLFLMATWVCFRNRTNDSARHSLLKICAVILLMLMISPVSWIHNFVLVVLPAAVALGAWRSGAGRPSSAIFGWALLGYLAGSLLAWIDWFNYFGSTLWGTFFLWAAFIRAALKNGESTRQSSEAGSAEAPKLAASAIL